MVQEDHHAKFARLRLSERTLTLMFFVSVSLLGGECAGVGPALPIAPEPVGSGARALGQSAFIAVADDATAASWNPAGLINLERPEASFVGVWRTISDDRSSNVGNRIWIGNTWDMAEINFMSYAHPLEVGNTDTVLSVNYHQAYDLGLAFDRVTTYYRGSEVESIETIRGRWEGAISAYSVAGGLSMPSCPEVTFGASLNWYNRSLLNDHVWQGSNTIWTDFNPDVAPQDDTTQITTETLDDFRGHNFTVGFLWDVYEREENLLSLGLVCHTPFTAKVDWEKVGTRQEGDETPEPISPDRERLSVDFPLSLGVGVNYRFHDELSGALDVQWTNWSECTYPGPESTLSRDALAVRLGFERLWPSEPSGQSVHALRGGVFYEPRPAWRDILPVYGVSLGLGWTVKERFSLDFAYQFRWGEEDLGEFDYRIEEHWLIGSVIVYFR